MSRRAALAAELLLVTDPEELRAEVEKLWRQGVLNGEFRQYLEKCARGQERSSIEPFLAEALLRQILMLVFIPPPMPQHIREFYDAKIRAALNPPKAPAVEEMLDELKSEGLLNQAFAELFLHQLQRIGGIVAQSYWEMCRERLDESVLQEIDFWLG